MMLIELNGLPGCGKSTVAEELISEIRKNELKCVAYNEVHEKIPKGVLKSIKYILHNWDFREIRYLWSISRCTEYESIKTQMLRIATAEQICVNYRKLEPKIGICIIDQGLIQAIASILYTFNINNRDKVKKIARKLVSKYIDSLFIVNACLSPIKAKDRIRFRNFDHGSRLNYIKDDEELIMLLEKQQTNIDILRDSDSSTRIRSIDMNLEATENAHIMMRWINSSVKK